MHITLALPFGRERTVLASQIDAVLTTDSGRVYVGIAGESTLWPLRLPVLREDEI